MKTFNTMITQGYVIDWTATDGVREFLSNALDGDAPFHYDVGLDFIEIVSVGITLDTSCFLMGVSGNRHKKDAIGVHGEGSLVGLVPILREGKEVKIYNGDLIWTPEFVLDTNFNKEVLVINETVEYSGNKDYKVVISNLDQDEINTIIENCLYLQDPDSLGNFVTAKCGSRVFFDKKGKLYVGGMFVCTTDLTYTYDLHPSKIKLNRDRKQVADWDLKGVTANILKEVADSKRIVELADKGVADVAHFEYNWHVSNISDELATESYNYFKEAYGEDAIVAEDYSDMTSLAEKGYEKPVVVKPALARLIKLSDSYQEKLAELTESIDVEPEDNRSPIEMLEDWYNRGIDGNDDNCNREYRELLDTFKNRGVSFDN